jgi:hypothetical protein
MSSPETTHEGEQAVSRAIDKVNHGQADETPVLALTGVTIVVFSFVAFVLGLSLLLYYLV